MITLIQIKQVLRDKRFIFFTLLLPCIWYIFMIKVIPSVKQQPVFAFSLFLLSGLMGILGNSLVTMSKRISLSKRYYLIQSHLSHYSIQRYMCSQLLSQLFLNSLIITLVLVLGVITGMLPINVDLLWAILLLTLIGIFLTVVGFTFGIAFSSSAIDNGATPLMFVVAALFIPFNTFASGTFVTILTKVQALLPPYYLFEFFQRLLTGQSLHLTLLKFLASLIVSLIPFALIIHFKLLRQN